MISNTVVVETLVTAVYAFILPKIYIPSEQILLSQKGVSSRSERWWAQKENGYV